MGCGPSTQDSIANNPSDDKVITVSPSATDGPSESTEAHGNSPEEMTMMARPTANSTAGNNEADEEGPHGVTLGHTLGGNSFTTVYTALHTHSGHQVAIKAANQHKLSVYFLQQEARVLRSLSSRNHPNIIQFYKVRRRGDRVFMYMEHASTDSLRCVVRNFAHGMTDAVVANYVTQLLQALECVHSNRIVHCDVNASNLVATNDGVLKLVDFGSAIYLTSKAAPMEELQRRTKVLAQFVLCPHCTAPEVLGRGHVTYAADIWSVGALVMELMTQQQPFGDLSPKQALAHIVELSNRPVSPSQSGDVVPIPSSISNPDLRDFLRQCFTLNPARRPSALKLLSHPWLLYRESFSPSRKSTSPPMQLGVNDFADPSLSGLDQANIDSSVSIKPIDASLTPHTRQLLQKMPIASVDICPLEETQVEETKCISSCGA